MKSIIEEASSIAKAVEAGWEKAGKPQEFTVKIFEEAKRNFIGLTTRSAKVGIFFQNTPETNAEPVKQSAPKAAQRRQINHDIEKKPAPVHTPAARAELPAPNTQPIAAVEWTPLMMEAGAQWLKGALESMDKGSVEFTYSISGPTLQFLIQEQIISDPQQEKHLFINFSTLILQAVKKKTRKSLKGYRVSVFKQK